MAPYFQVTQLHLGSTTQPVPGMAGAHLLLGHLYEDCHRLVGDDYPLLTVGHIDEDEVVLIMPSAKDLVAVHVHSLSMTTTHVLGSTAMAADWVAATALLDHAATVLETGFTFPLSLSFLEGWGGCPAGLTTYMDVPQRLFH